MLHLALALGALLLGGDPRPAWQDKVDAWVSRETAAGEADFLVVLEAQADLTAAAALSDKGQRGAFVARRLREVAETSQPPVIAALERLRVRYQPFWIANMILVRGGPEAVAAMAGRQDVRRISANPRVRGPEPRPESREAARAPAAVEWGVQQIHAPQVWAAGFTGQTVVVAGQDTGYQWDHPALKNAYRGWNGAVANHSYNWHDAIHTGGGVCGANAPAPCDDFGHGTHTMGTMVGDDGAGNQVGVAPGARWIGCRNMDQGNGTPATYSECFQWFVAPTDSSGNNPDPSKAPHVINNSWGCPPSEGCTDPNVLKTVVENTVAAGIVVVASAGNSGSDCSSVSNPPSLYAAAFAVGATDSTDGIAGFSSRGPVTIDGSGRMKPDVSAPGMGVRSSVPGNAYAVFTGTSMAGPHVVGAVALLLSAAPSLVGQVSSIESLLESSAVPGRAIDQTCGGVSSSTVPNNIYGWGRIDALAAFQSARRSGTFFTVTPCRLLDTRDPAGPWGGPALASGADRTFAIAGRCQIPAGASAVSVNAVVVTPSAGPGFLTLYPGGATLPLSATLNYQAGQTRANNAIVRLGAAGDLTVRCQQGGGTAHLVLDVTGYFP
jgi:serine protease AprX